MDVPLEDRLAALAADCAVEVPSSTIDRWIRLCGEVVWSAAERIDAGQPRFAIHWQCMADLVWHLGQPDSSEEEQELAALALVRYFYGPQLIQDPLSEAYLFEAMTSVILVAGSEKVRNARDPLRTFAKALCVEANRTKLGPGWSRKAKGLEMSLPPSAGTDPEEHDPSDEENREENRGAEDLVIHGPEDLMSQEPIEADHRHAEILSEIRGRLGPRERQLFDLWKENPGADDRYFAELLGITPLNARQIQYRIRKKASAGK